MLCGSIGILRGSLVCKGLWRWKSSSGSRSRRISSVHLYVKDVYASVKEKTGLSSSIEVLRAVSSQWKELSEDEKTVYKRRAKEIRMSAGLSPLDMEAQPSKAQETAQNRERADILRRLGLVRSSGLILFMKSLDSAGDVPGDVKDRIEFCAKRWKALSPTNRARYVDKARQLNLECRQRRAEVIKTLEDQGSVELLRKLFPKSVAKHKASVLREITVLKNRRAIVERTRDTLLRKLQEFDLDNSTDNRKLIKLKEQLIQQRERVREIDKARREFVERRKVERSRSKSVAQAFQDPQAVVAQNRIMA